MHVNIPYIMATGGEVFSVKQCDFDQCMAVKQLGCVISMPCYVVNNFGTATELGYLLVFVLEGLSMYALQSEQHVILRW